jgi:hypothetical protein
MTDTDTLSNRVSECYQRAAECRARAAQASGPSAEASFRKMERRWLDLARTCELDESAYRLSQTARYIRQTTGRPFPTRWR